MNTVPSFGRWLKAQRRANDLTQDQLARRVYCAEITIRKIEASDLRPSRELAEALARALKVEPSDTLDVVRWARQVDLTPPSPSEGEGVMFPSL